jgi:hypothetical protein
MAKQVGRDHDLALALWNEPNHDAKIIASLIDDPKQLTRDQVEKQVVFVNSGKQPDLPRDFAAVRYPTTTRTNWHYECARDLAAGRLEALFAPGTTYFTPFAQLGDHADG